MQNMSNYPNTQNAQNSITSKIKSLVAISYLDKGINLEERIVSLNTTQLVVNGEYTLITNRYIVIGHEIAYIESANYNGGQTTFTISREYYGTKSDTINLVGYYVRTVSIFNNIKEWSFNSYTSSKTDIFPFALESGSVEILQDIQDFDNNYKIRKKKSAVYLFKGFNNELMLKYTGFISSKNGRKESYNREGSVSIRFNDKFVKWFNNKIVDKISFNVVKPKEFLSTILQYPIELINYKNGNIEDDFNTTNNAYTSEYSYYKDILKEFAKTGVRFSFNELEEITITTDIIVDNITPTPVNVTDTNILELKLEEEDAYIVNKITGNYYERKPLIDFENELNNNYVSFGYNIDENTPFTLLTEKEGVIGFNSLTITNSDLDTKTDIGDLVLIKDNDTGLEFYGKTVRYFDGSVEILMGFDKDYSNYYRGRLDNLKTLGFTSSKTWEIYFYRKQLPYIYQERVERDGETVSSNLQIPLRPQITGQADVKLFERSITFGYAEDINIGEYTGLAEEISKIYKTHLSSDLKYGQELTQFRAGSEHPVYALSSSINDVNYDKRGNDEYLTFDTFNNSNLEISINPSEKYDAIIQYKNTKEIDVSEILELEQNNMTQVTANTFEISNTYYNMLNIGDVITLKQPTTYTNDLERNEYNENHMTNWIITSLFTQDGLYYMLLNGDIKDTFDFTVYPATSIVFLNEFYFTGNPILQNVSPFEDYNTTSINENEEQEISIDGKLLSYEGFGTMVDYYKTHFGATDNTNTKYILPLQIRDNIQLQKQDVITIKGYDEFKKFVILGEETKDALSGNKSTYYVMNLNDTSSSSINIKLRNLLEFTPITVPNYNHTGNEGTEEEVNTGLEDGSLISNLDDKYGMVAFKPISPNEIIATIDTNDDSLITLKDIVITNHKYDTFLTQEGQYRIISIDNEHILTKVENNNLRIVKRTMIKSTKTNISTGKKVRFNSITSINIEGSLRTAEANIGDTERYMNFTQEDGLDILSNKIKIQGTQSLIDFSPSGTDKINIATDGSNGEFSVGNINSNSYLNYTSGLLSVKSNYINITGGSINISTNDSKIQFDDTNSIIELNKSGNADTSKLEINKNTDVNYFLFDKNSSIIKSNNIIMSGGEISLSATDSFNINTNNFNLITTGNMNISNANNQILFDNNTSLNSFISMNNGSVRLGKLATGENGIYIGETNKYLKYDGNDLDVKTNKGYIGSTSTYFDITNEKLFVGSSESNSNIFQVGTTTGNYIGFDGNTLSLQGNVSMTSGKIDITTTHDRILLTDEDNLSTINLNNGNVVLDTNGILAKAGSIGGWIINEDLLKSANSGARVELNKAKNRMSIFDNSSEKVVMGYLNELDKNIQEWDNNRVYQIADIVKISTTYYQSDINNNTSNPIIENWTIIIKPTWGVADYGFWAKDGDNLKFDGDAEYISGDWIVKNDGSYLIKDGGDNTIIRLGTDTGEKGMFVYDTSGTKLAEYSSSRINVGNTTDYLNYESGILEVAGNIIIKNPSTVRADINVEDGSTNGATWGTDLNNIPSRLQDTPSLGLNLTPNYLGYYNGLNFQSYIDKDGNFLFAGNVNNYIGWSSTGNGLDIISEGDINIQTNNFLLDTEGSVKIGSTNPNGLFQVGLDTGKHIQWENGELNIKGDITVTGGDATVVYRQDTPPTLSNTPYLKNGDIWVDTSTIEEITYIATNISQSNSGNVLYGGGIYGEGLYGTGIWYPSSTNNMNSLTYATMKLGKDAVGTGKDGFSVNTNGWININNGNNQMYFEPNNSNTSFLDLARDGNGRFQIGNTSSNNYLKFENGLLNIKGSLNISYTDIENTPTQLSDINLTEGDKLLNIEEYASDNRTEINYTNVIANANGFLVNTNAIVNLKNTNNELYFGTNTTKSYIDLAKTGNGRFQVGNVADNHIKYEDGDLKVKTDDVEITGGIITLSATDRIDISNNGADNRLYMDDSNSYLHLNTNGTASATDYLQIGDDTTTDYIKYNENGIEFKGKYFNKTAYCSTKEEFMGALDTSKNKNGYGGSNPYFNKEILDIVIISNINISNITDSDILQDNYLYINNKKISSSIKDIILNFGSYAMELENSYIEKINILNIGVHSSYDWSILFYVNATMSETHISISGSISKSYDINTYIKNTYININSNFGKDNVFNTYKDISNCIIDFSNYIFSSSAKDITVFKNTSLISNIQIKGNPSWADTKGVIVLDESSQCINILIEDEVKQIGINSSQIDNVNIDFTTNYLDTNYLFEDCSNLNNIKSDTTRTKHMRNCEYVLNSKLPTGTLTNVSKDSNNTWNYQWTNVTSTTTLKVHEDKVIATPTSPTTISIPTTDVGREYTIYNNGSGQITVEGISQLKNTTKTYMYTGVEWIQK